jgi:hypothetical protein
MVTPVRNTKLSDAIDVLCPEYKLELEINPGGTTPQWGNVIHFTADNAHGGPGDCCNAGRRVPGTRFLSVFFK